MKTAAEYRAMADECFKCAREARAAQFRVCEQCGRSLPPEWLRDERTCQACARQQIVH